MKENYYKKYKAEDFISDENFSKIFDDGIASPELLDKLLEDNPEKRQDINLAVKIIQELNAGKFQNLKIRKVTLWNKIILKQKRQIQLKFFRYAAAVFLIIGIGSLSFYLINQQSKIEKYTFLKDTSSNNAILILADGKQIAISNKQSKVQYSSDGTEIVVNDTSKIEQGIPQSGINQIIVPYGKRSKISLSDGSVVWLNSGSKLAYRPVFNGKIREVYLQGEAFFDVTKDPDKPFFVRTKVFNIRVIGTMFDVQAYNEDNDYKAVVVSGKVSLNIPGLSAHSDVLLEPDQQASLLKGKDNFQISQVENTNKYIDWINGYYYLENETLSSVLRKISRYYNINIEINIRSDISKINGKLDLKENPEKVLEGLAIISNTKYFKDDDRYMFISK